MPQKLRVSEPGKALRISGLRAPARTWDGRAHMGPRNLSSPTPSLCRGVNWASRKPSDLPEVTQLANLYV